MSLHVLEPGLFTLVVDRGRPVSRRLGVPSGGAADRKAYELANALVGNPPGAAALEIALAGPTLKAGCELAGVVYGAPFELGSDRQTLTTGKTFTLAPNETLRIGGARRGLRAYLAIRGGLQTPVVLHSRSGLAPITQASELPCFAGKIHPRFVLAPPEWGADQPGGPSVLRVLDSLQADWFRLDEFYDQTFAVLPASNRMGLRLSGAALTLPDRELVSEPVCPGTVQVTNDGQCIVIGVDGQTIGGYPKIAQVIQADLDRLGQLRPGDQVRFHRVSLAEAMTSYREQKAKLDDLLQRLCVSLEGC